jgi:hypothetical protein
VVVVRERKNSTKVVCRFMASDSFFCKRPSPKLGQTSDSRVHHHSPIAPGTVQTHILTMSRVLYQPRSSVKVSSDVCDTLGIDRENND